jgi:hypothetical protein
MKVFVSLLVSLLFIVSPAFAYNDGVVSRDDFTDDEWALLQYAAQLEAQKTLTVTGHAEWNMDDHPEFQQQAQQVSAYTETQPIYRSYGKWNGAQYLPLPQRRTVQYFYPRQQSRMGDPYYAAMLSTWQTPPIQTSVSRSELAPVADVVVETPEVVTPEPVAQVAAIQVPLPEIRTIDPTPTPEQATSVLPTKKAPVNLTLAKQQRDQRILRDVVQGVIAFGLAIIGIVIFWRINRDEKTTN